MASTRGRQVVVPLTNKSGGSVIAGDVVIVDTANNEAFTTTTTGRLEVSVGIAQESIASNATGRVLVAGYAALVNVPASVTRGHYLETHTVAKQATGNSTRRSGSFGQFLTTSATPTAVLWGQTDQTASGASTPVFVGARINRSTSLSITTATSTDVTMPNEDFDTDAFHASSDAFVTIPTGKDGKYEIVGWVNFANSTAGTFRLIRLYVNATMVAEAQMPFHTNVGVSATASTIYSLVATDTVRIKVYQDSGGALNVLNAWLAVALLGT